MLPNLLVHLLLESETRKLPHPSHLVPFGHKDVHVPVQSLAMEKHLANMLLLAL